MVTGHVITDTIIQQFTICCCFGKYLARQCLNEFVEHDARISINEYAFYFPTNMYPKTINKCSRCFSQNNSKAISDLSVDTEGLFH